jgi:hypothetical protein
MTCSLILTNPGCWHSCSSCCPGSGGGLWLAGRASSGRIAARRCHSYTHGRHVCCTMRLFIPHGSAAGVQSVLAQGLNEARWLSVADGDVILFKYRDQTKRAGAAYDCNRQQVGVSPTHFAEQWQRFRHTSNNVRRSRHVRTASTLSCCCFRAQHNSQNVTGMQQGNPAI